MTLESQVCSLELAKKLKELGVPQKTIFFWATDEELLHLPLMPNQYVDCSAYLASELGEMLPQSYVTKSNLFQRTEKCEICGKNPHPSFEEMEVNAEFDWVRRLKHGDEIFWQIRYSYDDPSDGTKHYMFSINGDTEADCRAKILIYLIENHLISVEELGK